MIPVHSYSGSQCIILCCHLYPYEIFVACTSGLLDDSMKRKIQQCLGLTMMQCRAHCVGEAAISPHLFPAGIPPLLIPSTVQRRLRLNQQTEVAAQTTIMGSPLLSGKNYHCAPLTSKLIALGCTGCTSVAVESHKNTHKRAYP